MENYQDMYNFVMRNYQKQGKTTKQIIDYLVRQCYYIELHNDELIDRINAIKQIVGVEDPGNYEIDADDLPF